MKRFIVAVRRPGEPWRTLATRDRGEQAIDAMLQAERDYPAPQFELSVFPEAAMPKQPARGVEARLAVAQ